MLTRIASPGLVFFLIEQKMRSEYIATGLVRVCDELLD
jgi:hypothetical protein